MSVDPLINENGEAHKTSRYEIMNRSGNKARLVIRRGQEFYLNLMLSRNYDPTIDGISIVFTLDGVERPMYGHGTLVAIPVLDSGEKSEGSWQATVDAAAENAIRIKASRRYENLGIFLVTCRNFFLEQVLDFKNNCQEN